MIPSVQIRQVPIAGLTPRPYRMAAWRPAPPAAAPVRKAVMGQAGAGGALASLLGAAIGASTAWVGFATGAREKGFLSVLGYVIGSLGALGAVGGTLSALMALGGASLSSAEKGRRR